MTAPNFGREYRRQQRLELRNVDDGHATFDGYATVWDHAYDVLGGPDKGGWTETVARGAARKTLAERTNRALLYGHDHNQVLATTRTGMLTFADDEIGLRVEARLDLSVARIADIVRQVENGTVDEMSIGFFAIRSDWSDDYTVRTIQEIKLVEASVVWAGANDATVATVDRAARAAIAEARAAAVPQFSARLRAELLAEAERLRRI
jgi:HK97 family phage prohead protease